MVSWAETLKAVLQQQVRRRLPPALPYRRVNALKNLIGAMRLYHHQVWDIAESDIDSLQILAEMIGVAMSYARLRNAVQSVYEVVRKVCPLDPKPAC